MIDYVLRDEKNKKVDDMKKYCNKFGVPYLKYLRQGYSIEIQRKHRAATIEYEDGRYMFRLWNHGNALSYSFGQYKECWKVLRYWFPHQHPNKSVVSPLYSNGYTGPLWDRKGSYPTASALKAGVIYGSKKTLMQFLKKSTENEYWVYNTATGAIKAYTDLKKGWKKFIAVALDKESLDD